MDLFFHTSFSDSIIYTWENLWQFFCGKKVQVNVTVKAKEEVYLTNVVILTQLDWCIPYRAFRLHIHYRKH